MTPQELYDLTILHLWRQGGPAKNGNICLYRTPEGRKCAAGYWMLDDKYHPEMEAKNINEDSMLPHIPMQALREEVRPHLNLLRRLQNIHDTSNVVAGKWDKRHILFLLTEAATLFSLNNALAGELFKE